jgi:Mg2+/Co2+ transporter CorB
VLILLLSPVVTVVRTLVRGLLRVIGIRPDPAANVLAIREEIAGAIALGHSEGAVEKEDRDRLLGALDLAHRTVEEVMVHRSRIEMLDADSDPNDLIARVLASSHTRLPLYRETHENIVGVIHAKDLLRAVERFRRDGDGVLDTMADLDILSVAMKPYFVPDTTPLDEQMRQFLKRRTHFALVVDEYGALRGLITLEDILEEIVGDITDEFDVVDKQPRLTPTETGDYVVDGSIPIRDLNRMMEWQLPDDEATTLAGLVIHEAQAIPNAGQCFSFHGFRFEVMEKRDNRLTRLRLRPIQS